VKLTANAEKTATKSYGATVFDALYTCHG